MANVKITALTNIGSNILYSALIPMVNMAGSPVTQQGNIQILGNYILSSAGSANFVPAAISNIAYSVVNAAQPNITSVGTLTSLTVTGNATAGFFIGDGGLLTNVTSAGSSISNGTSNVAIPTAGGNINISRGGVPNVLVVTGTGVNVAGTLNSTGNLISGNMTTTNLNVTGNVTSNLLPNANITFNLGSSTQRWKDIWLANSTIYLGNSTISAGDANSVVFSGSLQADGNITANTGSDVTITTATGNTVHAWSFGADGNLTLPNNTFAVNYANGTPVSISGGSANIGNFVFTANTMRLNNAVNSNLYIQNDTTAKAQIIVPSSADANTVELTMQNMGDSGVHVLTGPSGEFMWHFDATGNFNAPGNTILGGTQIFVGPGAEALPNIANTTLVISSNSEAFIQSIINNVSDIGSADWIAQGHFGDDDGGYADFGFNSASHSDPEYSLTGPGDGYVLVQGYYSGQAPALGGGNLILATGSEGTDRNIIFGTGGYTSANMFAMMSDANNAFELSRSGASIKFGDNTVIGEIEGAGTFGIAATANSSVLVETSYDNGAFLTSHVWEFSANGQFTPPTLNVDLHNGGIQVGQVLQFGDPGLQAIITGPTPNPDTAAQRLIIQGQRGDGLGEGGDVYIWGGDANLNGGDIKIYAGDADDVTAGYGGYVNIDGGAGFDGGGDVNITGGSSANNLGGTVSLTGGSGAAGGPLNISGGQSSVAGNDGGAVTIQGGYGTNNGGAVTLQGGPSALGLAYSGNVLVQSSLHTWTFDSAGNLVFAGNTLTISTTGGSAIIESTANTVLQMSSSGTDSSVNMIWVDDITTPVRIAGVAVNSPLNAGDADVGIITGNTFTVPGGTTYIWNFSADGILTLGGGNSLVQSIANSSLDPLNPSVSTIVLTPDQSYNLQALVLDPTAPGHIHLRAPSFTGNIDEPAANLFLGGEASSFEVGYSSNGAPNVYIHSNNYTWTFNTTGDLVAPSGANISTQAGPNVMSLNAGDQANSYYSYTLLDTNAWSAYAENDQGTNPAFAGMYFDCSALSIPVVTIETQKASDGILNIWEFNQNGHLTVPGNISNANVVSANVFQSNVLAFASLPAATAGLRSFINDANLVASGNFGSIVSGGGSNIVPIYGDGTNWRIG